MSFLDKYAENHRLAKVSPKVKKNLANLEKKLDKSVNGDKSFEDALKEHSAKLSDLIQRVGDHFDGFKISWGTAIPSLRFVISISTEAYQIVDSIKDDIVTPGMTEAEAAEAKTNFGKELVWFVWSAVGPLDNMFKLLPFKKTIEKKLVMWVAGMGLNAARNFFNANKNKDVESFAVNEEGGYLKAI